MSSTQKPRRRLSKPYLDERRSPGQGQWVITEMTAGGAINYAGRTVEEARCKAGLHPQKRTRN